MRTLALGITLALSTMAGAANAAVDYAAGGSYAFSTTSLASPTGGAQGGYLVVPSASGSYPLLVTSHGFSATADNQIGWAEHFASWGFVVVVPNFPNTLAPDTNVDRDIIKALVALYSSAATVSPAQGKVDAAHIGLEGHSAGGLATAVAAADLKPGATVLFDPVDKDAVGSAAYGTLCAPVLSLFADPSSCNNSAGWAGFTSVPRGTLISAHVVGSTHCDGENQDRPIVCGTFCGGAADATRQAVYARYATAFFLAQLRADTAAAATLTAASLSADAALSGTHVALGTPCTASTSDAGSPTPADDAGTPPSSGNDTDSGTPPTAMFPTTTDGGTAPSSSGCACHASPTSATLAPLALLAGAAALLRRRRSS